MNEITVTLPIETINASLHALTKMPYEFAQPHIDLIRDRAATSMQEAQKKRQASLAVDPSA